jgi:hypothetical protein
LKDISKFIYKLKCKRGKNGARFREGEGGSMINGNTPFYRII